MKMTFAVATMTLVFLLSACADVSLVKPIKMKLGPEDIAHYTQRVRDFRRGDYDREMNGGIVICGRTEESHETDGELVYQLRVDDLLFNGLSNGETVPDELLIISPTIENGGIAMDQRKYYKLFAVRMSDRRLATWNGIVVEVPSCGSAPR